MNGTLWLSVLYLIQLTACTAGESLPEPPDVDGWSSCRLSYNYPATRYRMFGATVASRGDLTPKNCYHLMAADGSACQVGNWSRPDFAVLLMHTDYGTLKLKIVTNSETLEADRSRTDGQLQLFVDGLPYPLNSTRQAFKNFSAIVPEHDGTVVTLQNADIWARFNGSSLDLRLRRAGASADACGRCDAGGRLTREERTVHLLYRNRWLTDETTTVCNRERPWRPIVWNEDQADEERANRTGLSAKCDVNATQPLRPFDGRWTTALTLPADGCYAVLAADPAGCGRGFVERPSYVLLARRLDDKQIVLKVVDNGEIVTVKRYRTSAEPRKLKADRTVLRDGNFDHSRLQLTTYRSHYDIYSSDFVVRFDGQRAELRLSQSVDGPAACGACFGGDGSATTVIRAWLTRHGALDDQPAGCPTAEELGRVLNGTTVPNEDPAELTGRTKAVWAHLIEIEPDRVCSSVWPEDTCIEPYRPVYQPAQLFYETGKHRILYNNTVSFRCYDRGADPDAERLIQLAVRLRTAFKRYRNVTADYRELRSEVVAVQLIADQIDAAAARRHRAASYEKVVPTPGYCILPE